MSGMSDQYENLKRCFFMRYRMWDKKIRSFNWKEKVVKNWSEGCLESKTTRIIKFENRDILSIIVMATKIWYNLLI